MRILSRLLWFAAILASSLPAQTRDAEAPAALVVRVEGPSLDTPTVALVERALRSVRDIGAQYLILEISSTATQPEDMRRAAELLKSLQTEDVATVAFVEEYCFPAATMLALGCDQVFMKPKLSSLAGSTVVEADFGEMRRLMVGALEKTPRNNAKARLLVEAMVDQSLSLFEVTYSDASGIEMDAVVTEERLEAMRNDADIKFAVQPTNLSPRPLTLSASQAEALRLIDGVYDSVEILATDRLNLDDSLVERLSSSWSEGMVGWLFGMRHVLFVIGFILLLIEFKTPGFALPGILGVIMFGLAFFGSYMVGLADITEILLFFLGIGLLAVEIWIMPGMVVFGVAGFLCIVAGLIFSQQQFYFPSNASESELMKGNLINFTIVLLIVMLGIWIVYANLHRIPILKNAIQPPPDLHPAGVGGTSAHEARLASLDGQVGVLETDLRPAGVMAIGDERFDVVSEGSFVDRGRQVRVIEVRGNRIVVTPVETASEAVEAGEAGEGGEVSIAVLIFLVLLGLALIVAEVFFVSFGVLAILSGVALVAAVFLAFTGHGEPTGYTFLIACAIGVPVTVKLAFVMLPRTRLGRMLYLEGNVHEEVSGAAQEEGLESLLGKRGVAAVDLRPSGYAEIEGRRVDVVTRGEVIPKSSPIKVIRIELNQVFVALERA